MFCPPPDQPDSQNIDKTHITSRRKRKKKCKNKKRTNKKELFKKKSKLAATMSSWAENFTVAATWQLKHQLAYWKAKAIALEYENNILHEIIRTNHCNPPTDSVVDKSDSDIDEPLDSIADNDRGTQNAEEGDNFEVSEEFIEFLRANAKYKEDARLERERLKRGNTGNTEGGPQPGPSKREDNIAELKELYGANWQKISALETSLLSTFIDKSDKCKPVYWPNIPFNFNFS